MNTSWVLQAPAESKQHEINWSTEMVGEEIIDNSVWSISPDTQNTGALPDEGTIDTDGTTAIIVLSGLVLGKSYQLLNTVTTTTGRILSREITIRCDYR